MKTSITLAAAAAVAFAAAAPLTTALAAGASAEGAKPPAAAQRAPQHRAVGVVRSVDAGAGSVTIAHQPVKSLGWPAMAMAFQVRDQRLLAKLRAGSTVEFDFEQTNDGFLVTAVR